MADPELTSITFAGVKVEFDIGAPPARVEFRDRLGRLVGAITRVEEFAAKPTIAKRTEPFIFVPEGHYEIKRPECSPDHWHVYSGPCPVDPLPGEDLRETLRGAPVSIAGQLYTIRAVEYYATPAGPQRGRPIGLALDREAPGWHLARLIKQAPLFEFKVLRREFVSGQDRLTGPEVTWVCKIIGGPLNRSLCVSDVVRVAGRLYQVQRIKGAEHYELGVVGLILDREVEGWRESP